MHGIQQFFIRHLITAPVTFGSMIYFIVGTGMNIFAIAGLSALIYFGGTFAIKQVQISSNLKTLSMTRSEYNHIQGQLSSARTKVKQLNGYYGKVRSVQAFRQLHEMNTLSRKILSIVKTNPKKFYHVEKFFYAHLDSAVELTSKYALLVNQPLKDKDVRIALQNTRETLSDVNMQLEQDMRNVLSSDLEKLQMEIDFVDVTMNRKKPLLEMKGDHPDDRK
ncbi:5-bromo-4-chloroindolyl phosphate hydrolysis family protein [Sporosarcina sp. G11-34]|uniref:5-bromo-4-chloroindolyl phosphate hydrolysis family protein n=1 Tax=Sporosarcina sp. G11-34 TaxID=2849605 RepID=UPI0022A901CC|nr:5-bromo-4-chloroindolyl phosphate hydrolysis family protein [Sporosarcina sp. G11-34]MCZ2258234.1 5-bromo-4-chloroindolyl phosphate hydrolysis family protein [Sporosarcina sp. G11-34]